MSQGNTEDKMVFLTSTVHNLSLSTLSELAFYKSTQHVNFWSGSKKSGYVHANVDKGENNSSPAVPWSFIHYLLHWPWSESSTAAPVAWC